jgi:hypothetical protein
MTVAAVQLLPCKALPQQCMMEPAAGSMQPSLADTGTALHGPTRPLCV